MSARICAAVFALALLPAAAPANWFRARAPVVSSYYPGAWMPAYRAYYYVPTPVYYVPTVAIPVTTRPYAVPTAAPPSVSVDRPYSAGPTTREPPKVSESRSDRPQESREPPRVDEAGSTSRKLTVEKSGEVLCRVGFLNLSERDLVIKIDGTARPLPPGESFKIVSRKQFVWQIVGSEPQLERVPQDKRSLDIVIRR